MNFIFLFYLMLNKKNSLSEINDNTKGLNHYKKVLSKNIFDSLSDDEKELFINQIDNIERDLEHKNTIKIRVRPWVIKLLCKIAWVHDIRGWAYRGDTVYVWHKSDLFNPQLLQHESIHVAQQKELWGFITWLKKTVKDMKKYKEIHWDSPYIKYESSTLTPMELEAYTHQADKWYLKNREPFAYKKYETPEGEQKSFKKIGDRNDTEIKNQFKEKSSVAKNVEYDLNRLDQIINENKNTERTMRVFNSVDKVIELESVLTLLKEKLFLLQKNTFSNEYSKQKYLEQYWDLVDKYNREINNQNLTYIFEDDFTDKEVIQDNISRLSKDIDTYRKEPTRFRLEPKKSNGESIEIEIPKKD